MQEKKKKGKEKNISFPLQKHAKIQLLSTEEVVAAMGVRAAWRGHCWLWCSYCSAGKQAGLLPSSFAHGGKDGGY